jgi:geranylgeranyl pyrophosphate synthase
MPVFNSSAPLEAIEAALLRYLPSPQTAPKEIHEAMHYCLQAGGKRLRPTLLLLSANLYGAKLDPLPAAVAIECLHTYSLIHDDLPAMDDSPLRRGQPSAHVQFGEAMAILAGDALLTEAFRVLSLHYREDPVRAVALINCLSKAADSQHLIGGQVLDTIGEKKQLTAAEIDTIHQHKTADLITAALLMGLHLSVAPPEAFSLMESVGNAVGRAFQIVDDILDATASSDVLGKPVGQDPLMEKNTYVSLHGLEASKQEVFNLTEKAISGCKNLPDTDAELLIQRIQQLANRIR